MVEAFEDLDARAVAAFRRAVAELGGTDDAVLLSRDDRERDAARIITWARTCWVMHSALCDEDPAAAHAFADQVCQSISDVIDGVPDRG